MIGLGTIINTLAIIVGGILGLLFGKLINERIRNTLCTACGVSVIFIGISGALEGLLSVTKDGIGTKNSMLLVACLCLGAFIGELINFEDAFERFGEWLKIKSGNAKDTRFVDGFLTATFTVCIGAMAIVGSLSSGLSLEHETLYAKSLLDMIAAIIFATTLGWGVVFSSLLVFVYQGAITLAASLLAPVLSAAAITEMTAVGSLLIIALSLNLLGLTKIKVMNYVPAIFIPILLVLFM